MARLDPFGTHKRQIWQELCEHVPGTFFKGKWTKPDRVEAWHGDWMLTLDTFVVDKVVFTRMRAPYVNRDDFKFKIVRQHAGHKIGKLFGMKDIVVGHPEFDRDFIIKGSDQRKLEMMFANPDIRALINWQPKIQLELTARSTHFSQKISQKCQ